MYIRWSAFLYLELYTYKGLGGVDTYKGLEVQGWFLKEKIRQAEQVKITSGILNNSEVVKSQQ